MRRIPVVLAIILLTGCGLIGPGAGTLEITVTVDETALQRLCRNGRPSLCWPKSRDGLDATVMMQVTASHWVYGTSDGFHQQIDGQTSPGALVFRFEDLPAGDYTVRPFGIPNWGQRGFVPDQPVVEVRGGETTQVRMTYREVLDLPCWGTNGQLEGTGCGVNANW